MNRAKSARPNFNVAPRQILERIEVKFPKASKLKKEKNSQRKIIISKQFELDKLSKIYGNIDGFLVKPEEYSIFED